MTLLRRYERSLHLLVILGVIAYSVAEENMMYALVAAPIVLAAYLIVAGPRGRPLPRWGINLSLLAATGIMVLDWGGAIGSEVISVLCSYLVWLQLIKLFEPRTPRDQSQIILMSLMLVVGSCLTAVTVELGAVLLVYLPTLLITAMLYHVFEAHAWAGHPATASKTLRSDARPMIARAAAWLLGSASSAAHSPLPRTAFAGPTSRHDLTRTALAASILVAAVAPAVYIAMPRGVGDGVLGQWRPMEPTPVTGFRDHVQLGAQGLLTESQRTVMHVRAVSRGEAPLGQGRTLRLRGAVLDLYDPDLRTWRRSAYVSQSDRRANVGRDEIVKPMNPIEPLITLHVSLAEQPVNHLFSVWRPLWITWTHDAKRTMYEYNDFDWQARVPTRGDRFEYTAVCAPFDRSPARPPVFRMFRRDGPVPTASEPVWVNIRGDAPDPPPPPQFQEGPVRALAEQLLRDSRIVLDPADPDACRRAAGAFQRYLVSNFRYTTQLTAPAPGEDPIDMFLFNRERGGRGHCEYFASALAAMCLSVGVPARVVTGYIASEYDSASDMYTVRENHAHAWVEVETSSGRWEDVDPSPTEEVRRLHAPQGLLAALFRRATDAIQLAWVEGIVTFNRERQSSTMQALSIAPLDAFRALNRRISDMLATEAQIAHENRAVYFTRIAGWGVLTVTVLLLAVHVAATRGVPWMLSAIGFRKRKPEPPRDPAMAELDAVYSRLWTLLARAGLPRRASTPALAFLASAPPERAGLIEPARRLAERYYRVRFAGERAAGANLSTARGLLRDIERAARLR